MNRHADLIRFYDLLTELEQLSGGKRSLSSLSKYRNWPNRGVYFFFNSNEPRTESGIGPRVVRVGTHALTSGSKSTLRQRLSQHRGNLSGGGNHRGSIFRLLLGQAMLESGEFSSCISWGVKNDKRKASEAIGISRKVLDESEQPVELAVSEYLASLSLLWVEINDESSPDSIRGLIERNSIALLSNHERISIDSASEHWLGNNSNRPLVRQSGLWNQRHVNETHDPSFLDVFEKLVHQTGSHR